MIDTVCLLIPKDKMQFIEGLKNIEGAEVHGQPSQTLPNTVNFSLNPAAV